MLAVNLNSSNPDDEQTFKDLMWSTSSGIDVEMDNMWA